MDKNIFVIPKEKVLLIGVVILITITQSNTILTQNSSVQEFCVERDLQVTCDCRNQFKTLSLQDFNNFHSSINMVTIQNCQNVTLGSFSINKLNSLRQFKIINVNNLHLRENSLNWKGYETLHPHSQPHDYHPRTPGISIDIKQSKNVKIEEYAFSGKPIELKFYQVEFEKIQPLAFAGLTRLITLAFKQCIFKQIEPQGFKKIETNNLIISDSEFPRNVPSRSFADLDVLEEFQIINCNFQTINPTAFLIKKPKRVDILNSYFDTLNSESFVIQSTGLVTIKNNKFNHINYNTFIGISYIKEHRAMLNQRLIFDQNTFQTLDKQGYNFNRTSFDLKYGSIIVNKTCTCIDVEIWIENNELKEHIQCFIDNKKFQTIKATDYFKSSSCSSGTKTWIILVSVFAALLVLLIIAAVVIVFLYRRYKENKQKEYVNRGRMKNGSLGLIVPDGRTYKETEVHVIVEKAELLTTEL